MATYESLYAQLKGSDFIVYLAVCDDDPFKRRVAYKNLNGLEGTLNSAAFSKLGLEYSNLPAIVPAADLAEAIKSSTHTTVIWKSIDIAANGGMISGGGGSGMFHFKGSVLNHNDLPDEGNEVGDVYQVASEDYAEYVWVEKNDGSFAWDPIGRNITTCAEKAVIISGGSVAEPAIVSLEAGRVYLAVSPFTASLPESPENGTIIRIGCAQGQENMSIVPSGNDTVAGSSNPCIIGVALDGSYINNEYCQFIYYAGNWTVL